MTKPREECGAHRPAELDMHPLDASDRRRLARDVARLGLCTITKCCTEGIKITARVGGRPY